MSHMTCHTCHTYATHLVTHMPHTLSLTYSTHVTHMFHNCHIHYHIRHMHVTLLLCVHPNKQLFTYFWFSVMFRLYQWTCSRTFWKELLPTRIPSLLRRQSPVSPSPPPMWHSSGVSYSAKTCIHCSSLRCIVVLCCSVMYCSAIYCSAMYCIVITYWW